MKQILRKSLALILALGLLAASAGAAFQDAKSITHTQAVDVLVKLNILSGKPDGNFDPAAPVTRAEMAKIISVILNGGKVPRLESRTSYTYTDISTHWANLLIEYCNVLGIVGGRGDGTFDPDGSITARECAKMLLVMVGYEADKERFTGGDWAAKVDQFSQDLGLYTGLDSAKAGETISRDDAAQMVFNSLTVSRVTYWDQDGKEHDAPIDMGGNYLNDWFRMELKDGVLTPIG